MSIIRSEDLSLSIENSVIRPEHNPADADLRYEPVYHHKKEVSENHNWRDLLVYVTSLKDKVELKEAELELKIEMLQEDLGLLKKKNAVYKKYIEKVVDKNAKLIEIIKLNGIEVDESNRISSIPLTKTDDLTLIEEEVKALENLSRDKAKLKNIVQQFDVKDLIKDLGLYNELGKTTHLKAKRTSYEVESNQDELIALHLDSITGLRTFDLDHVLFCLSVSEDCVAMLSDVKRNMRYYMRGHMGPLYSCEIDTLNERIITAGSEGIVKIWNIKSVLDSKSTFVDYQIHEDIIWGIELIDKNGTVMTVSADGKDILWKPDQNGGHDVLYKKDCVNFSHDIIRTYKSPEDGIILSRNNDTVIDLFDVDRLDFKDIIKLDQTAIYINAIDTIIGGDQLLVGCENTGVMIVDPKSKNKVTNTIRFNLPVLDLKCVSEKYFIASDTSNTVKLFDLRKMSSVETYTTGASVVKQGINCLNFDPKGEVFAGGLDGCLFRFHFK